MEMTQLANALKKRFYTQHLIHWLLQSASRSCFSLSFLGVGQAYHHVISKIKGKKHQEATFPSQLLTSQDQHADQLRAAVKLHPGSICDHPLHRETAGPLPATVHRPLQLKTKRDGRMVTLCDGGRMPPCRGADGGVSRGH